MYIKSQFVDYYDDVALATGDPELKYIRNQTEKRVEAKRERRATLAGYSDRNMNSRNYGLDFVARFIR